MNRSLKILIVGLMCLLSLAQSSFAESKTIGVSITIPVIPGVNAPLKQEVKDTAQQEQAQNTETKSNSGAAIQEEETFYAENQAQTVKTIYSR